MADAPQSVAVLVDRFDMHREDYRRGRYNETQVRVELIDPIFVALGWDVHNTAGYAESPETAEAQERRYQPKRTSLRGIGSKGRTNGLLVESLFGHDVGSVS